MNPVVFTECFFEPNSALPKYKMESNRKQSNKLLLFYLLYLLRVNAKVFCQIFQKKLCVLFFFSNHLFFNFWLNPLICFIIFRDVTFLKSLQSSAGFYPFRKRHSTLGKMKFSFSRKLLNLIAVAFFTLGTVFKLHKKDNKQIDET